MLSEQMALGAKEVIEVWFLPDNRQAYSPRVLTEFSSIESAREYFIEKATEYFGTLELVKSVTTRYRIT